METFVTMTTSVCEHLADTSDTGNRQFAVTVALDSRLTEEQVDLVIVALITRIALGHLGHGDKRGLWDGEKQEDKWSC